MCWWCKYRYTLEEIFFVYCMSVPEIHYWSRATTVSLQSKLFKTVLFVTAPHLIDIVVDVADCLTCSLSPLKPFSASPNSEVTVEVAELCPEPQPFTSYLNHLYVYPQSLAFDTQKMFTRARNIACTVQLRDDDSENAKSVTVGIVMWSVLYSSKSRTVFK